MYTHNQTLNLFLQVTTLDPWSPSYKPGGGTAGQPARLYRGHVPLVRYTKQMKEEATANLIDSSFGDIPPPKQIEAEEEEGVDHFYPHWKQEINLNLVYD